MNKSRYLMNFLCIIIILTTKKGSIDRFLFHCYASDSSLNAFSVAVMVACISSSL